MKTIIFISDGDIDYSIISNIMIKNGWNFFPFVDINKGLKFLERKNRFCSPMNLVILNDIHCSSDFALDLIIGIRHKNYNLPIIVIGNRIFEKIPNMYFVPHILNLRADSWEKILKRILFPSFSKVI